MPAMDDGLRGELPVMGTARPWCGGDEPNIGVVGIDGQAPAVIPIASGIGWRPTVTAIVAPCGAAASGIFECQARAWTSFCAPGRWSCQDSPPSRLRIRPPSSMPTRSRPASCGEGAIHRAWLVQGRDGKRQSG